MVACGVDAARASGSVLAAALLKLATLPACVAVAAAQPAPVAAGSLEARVAQLGGSRPS